jgi:hypothetical protein
MKITNLKRLIIEDFDKDDQNLVSKIAFSLNPLMEQLTTAFNKGIDFDNLNQQYSSFTVAVDSLGNTQVPVQIKYDLKTKLKGIQVISAENLTDTTYPTGSPFISYQINANLITIMNITGLPANRTFRLSIVLIG